VFTALTGSQGRTEYHQDLPFFPLDVGSQAAVCWLPVDVATEATGAMAYVPGSHRWEEKAPTNLMTHGEEQNSALPDILLNEQAYGVRYYDARPGDMIVHHPATVHGSAGNTSSAGRRLAVSLRYVGDGVTWRSKAASMIHVPFLRVRARCSARTHPTRVLP
jgi:ectoine hydroxylase-related dioxygenase (phytanoyl-CoA dioxygenase family)